MKFLCLVYLAAICSSLTGCVTAARKVSNSRPVDSGRYYVDFAGHVHPRKRYAKAVAVRDKGPSGSVVKAETIVDGHALTGL